MSDNYASVNDLLSDDISGNTREVELPGGRRVVVRGLSRAELLAGGKGADGDAAEIERRNLAACMVTPALTYAQAAEWQRSSSPAVIALVSNAIRDLSGFGEGADKSGVDPARD